MSENVSTQVAPVRVRRGMRTWTLLCWYLGLLVAVGLVGHWLANPAAWWVWLVVAALAGLAVAALIGRLRPRPTSGRLDVQDEGGGLRVGEGGLARSGPRTGRAAGREEWSP